ncbi:MAG: peptidoglycan-binding protein LysM [Actinomycetota bacterium]
MGVFDFVRNAGAKIGIGKSTEEREKEAADEAVQRGLEAQKKMAAEAMEKRKEQKARQDDAAKARAEAIEARKAARRERRVAEGRERAAEYRKAVEIEQYIADLGLVDEDDDIEVRFDDGTAYIDGIASDQETREKVILAIGNCEGVGRVDEDIEVVAPEPEATFHTVEAGDTLWAVAEKAYGDGNKYMLIFEANKPMLTDPDLIFPGQVLRCPPEEAPAEA